MPIINYQKKLPKEVYGVGSFNHALQHEKKVFRIFEDAICYI